MKALHKKICRAFLYKNKFRYTISMLWLTQGQTSEKIVVTLTEKTVSATPNYLFVFKHVTTRGLISFEKTYSDDLSLFPKRYNEFEINTASLFTIPGQYLYKIYEQTDRYLLAEDGNILLTEDGEKFKAEGPGIISEVENGKMNLQASGGLTRTEYATTQTYNTYQG